MVHIYNIEQLTSEQQKHHKPKFSSFQYPHCPVIQCSLRILKSCFMYRKKSMSFWNIFIQIKECFRSSFEKSFKTNTKTKLKLFLTRNHLSCITYNILLFAYVRLTMFLFHENSMKGIDAVASFRIFFTFFVDHNNEGIKKLNTFWLRKN